MAESDSVKESKSESSLLEDIESGSSRKSVYTSAEETHASFEQMFAGEASRQTSSSNAYRSVGDGLVDSGVNDARGTEFTSVGSQETAASTFDPLRSRIMDQQTTQQPLPQDMQEQSLADMLASQRGSVEELSIPAGSEEFSSVSSGAAARDFMSAAEGSAARAAEFMGSDAEGAIDAYGFSDAMDMLEDAGYGNLTGAEFSAAKNFMESDPKAAAEGIDGARIAIKRLMNGRASEAQVDEAVDQAFDGLGWSEYSSVGGSDIGSEFTGASERAAEAGAEFMSGRVQGTYGDVGSEFTSTASSLASSSAGGGSSHTLARALGRKAAHSAVDSLKDPNNAATEIMSSAGHAGIDIVTKKAKGVGGFSRKTLKYDLLEDQGAVGDTVRAYDKASKVARPLARKLSRFTSRGKASLSSVLAKRRSMNIAGAVKRGKVQKGMSLANKLATMRTAAAAGISGAAKAAGGGVAAVGSAASAPFTIVVLLVLLLCLGAGGGAADEAQNSSGAAGSIDLSQIDPGWRRAIVEWCMATEGTAGYQHSGFTGVYPDYFSAITCTAYTAWAYYVSSGYTFPSNYMQIGTSYGSGGLPSAQKRACQTTGYWTYDINQLNPGDIVVFYINTGNGDPEGLGHVAIYLGNGLIAHSYTSSGTNPGITSIYSSGWGVFGGGGSPIPK